MIKTLLSVVLLCTSLAAPLAAQLNVPAPQLYPINAGAEDKPAYGFIDATGRTVVQPLYRWAGRWADGRALVRYIGEEPDAGDLDKELPEDPAELDKEEYGIIDAAGKMYKLDADYNVPYAEKKQQYYDIPYHFSEGLLRYRKGTNWGYVDKNGKVVIPARYYYADDFSEGFARVIVQAAGKLTVGYINRTGALVIPAVYQTFDTDARLSGAFSGGLAVVKVGGKYGFINKTGIVAIAAKYELAGPFHDGLAFVKVNGKYGYINKTGALVIPATFDEAYTFSEGLAHVAALNDLGFSRDGFIDKTGKLVIEAKYNTAASFSGGLAYVAETPDDPGTFINPQGQTVFRLPRKVVNTMAATSDFYYRFKGGVVPVLFATDYPNFGKPAYLSDQSMSIWSNDQVEFYCPPSGN